MNMKKAFLLVSVLLWLGMAVAVSAAQITLPNPLCLNGRPAGAPCIDSFTGVISAITTFISNIIGAVAVLVFLIAGILFVISGGSPEKISQARRMAIYAAIGVAIALAGKGLVEVIATLVPPPPPPPPP